MAVEHSANPDANLRAFAQRGDHRVEPAINECRSRCSVRTLTFVRRGPD